MAKKQRTTKQSKLEKAAKEEEEQKVLLADDESTCSSDEEPDEELVVKDSDKVNNNRMMEVEEEDSSEDDEELNEELVEKTQPEEPSPPAQELAFQSDGRYHNKQRCLILCSRGVTSRFRHLLEDLRTLIPHHKKDSKLDASKSDSGGIGGAVNDIAEIRGCNSVLFLECRKRQDAYLWLSHTNTNGSGGNANGPSAKFLVENIHTMDEMRLTGNCMKGSRPVLSFDTNFDQREELKLLKCLFTDVFGTPRGHPKSKPFVDRVMGFYYADGKVR